jgi:hypothetical protein
MAKKPVKEATRREVLGLGKEKLSIPEQPKSKGELVPVKPKAPTSRVPSVSNLPGIFGKFARGAARRSPLLEIILQNLPGKEEVSGNIKRHMENLRKEELTRRAFIKKMLKGTAKAGAAAFTDKRALLEGLLKGFGAPPFDEFLDVPDEDFLSIEEQILEDLQNARGNAPLRREIISKAVKDLGLTTGGDPFTADDPEGEFIPQTEELAQFRRLQHKLDEAIPPDPDDMFRTSPTFQELSDESRDLHNMDMTIESWGGPQGYADRLRDIVAKGEWNYRTDKPTTMEDIRENPLSADLLDENPPLSTSANRDEALSLSKHLDDQMREYQLHDAITEEDRIQIEQSMGEGETSLLPELYGESDKSQAAQEEFRKVKFDFDMGRVSQDVYDKAQEKLQGFIREDEFTELGPDTGWSPTGPVSEGIDKFQERSKTENEEFRKAIALKDHLSETLDPANEYDPFISLGEHALFDEVINPLQGESIPRENVFHPQSQQQKKLGFKEFSRRMDERAKGIARRENPGDFDDEIPF